MERKYKIRIPEPCPEDWNKMTPNDNGRFCTSCSKNVVDFTNMLPDEIQVYFQKNSNVCGRFKNTQLESLTIQIPNQVLYSQTNYRKIFLLALFIAMGTTLFSCADKNGNKQKIDKIEVVGDFPNKSNNKKGMTITQLPKSVDSSNQKQLTPKQIRPVPILKKKVEPIILTGIVSIEPHLNIRDTINNPIDYNVPFALADLDSKPYPPEGFDKFYEFIKANYVAPNKVENYTGRIFISFIVEKNGSLTNFKILRDLGMGSGEEVVRVLKTTGKWIPGKFNNHIVRSSYALPISFQPSK